MRAVLTILGKDLRLRLRDRSAIVIGVVTPFTLAFLLHLTLGGLDDFSAHFGVVDRDRGEIAHQFVTATRHLGGGIEVTPGLSEAQARAEVDSGKLDAAFVLPAGLTDDVLGQRPARIEVVGNADADIPVRVAQSVADRFASQVQAVRLSIATASAGSGGSSASGSPDGAAASDAQLVAAAQQQRPPVDIDELVADDRQLDTTTYQVAGLGALFVFFLVQYGVLGLVEETETGTMARLLVAPIPRLAIPVAKALVSVVVGVVALGVLVGASTLVMGAHWGDPLAVAVLIVAMVLAAVSITGVVAGVATNAEQAGGIQSVIALVLGLLGGAFFPLSRSGGWLSHLSQITPHYWFLRGLGEGRAGGLGDALPAVAVLLVFAVVVGGVGVVLLRIRGLRGAR
jgi:ABC-2 type transport system permease protein